MPSSPIETDLLIVGAGPVGLFLANECARRGLRYRVVESHAAQSAHSKALAVMPRTLEIFDMAGVVGPFLEAANRVTSVAIMAHQRLLAEMQFAPKESPYPFIGMVPQDVTERLLVEALQRRGGAVEYHTTFVSAEERDGGVSAVLERNGERINVQASYLVGCDGPHSTVRHLLQLPFEGAQYDDEFLLADIETNDKFPGNQMQLCPSEWGPLAIFPMSATHRRVVATIKSREGEAPSLELVRTVLAQRAPAGIEARALRWSGYFRIHHRQVGRMRVGRIFIAGDAAHIHSPFGGQGMNTGLQDAWNLAWKLDLALHCHGSEQLLDSYSAERHPVVKEVIKTTDFMTKAMGTSSRLAQALRDAFIPMVTRLPPFQHAFVQRLSQLGVAYRGSPIVEGAGERYFDPSLGGGDGIRSRFLLLLGTNAGAAAVDAAKELAGSFPDILELRRSPREGLTLVRPDGYVAYTAPDRDGAGLGQVRALLELQTG